MSCFSGTSLGSALLDSRILSLLTAAAMSQTATGSSSSSTGAPPGQGSPAFEHLPSLRLLRKFSRQSSPKSRQKAPPGVGKVRHSQRLRLWNSPISSSSWHNRWDTCCPFMGRACSTTSPTTFAPVDRIPVTADYVIGPGDELLIRAWGQIDLDIHARVDRNGSIFIPKVGNLNVSGLKFEQVRGFLTSQIGRIYQNFDLNVTMGDLRSIDIFVVGQAEQSWALHGKLAQHAGERDFCLRRTILHGIHAANSVEAGIKGGYRVRLVRPADQGRQVE